MIEAKQKEKSIFKLYEKYPYLNCKCCSNYNLDKIFYPKQEIIYIKKRKKSNIKKIVKK